MTTAIVDRKSPDTSLATTRFYVVGVGGLGCPILLGLLAAGARRFTLIDPDRVAESNLQRQVLFAASDRGRPKVEAAADFLRHRAPKLHIDTYARGVLSEDLHRAADESSIIIDGTDDAELGFELNDRCVDLQLRAVLAGALGWRGQAMAIAPGSACLRCVFETPPPPELSPSCAAAGVLGATTGLVGHAAAMMAAQFCAGQGETISIENPAGRLFTAELQRPRITTIRVQRRASCPSHPHPTNT